MVSLHGFICEIIFGSLITGRDYVVVCAFTATERMGQERVFTWGRDPKVLLQRGLPHSPPPLLLGGVSRNQPFPKPDVGPSSHYNLPNLLGPMGLFPSHQQQKKIFYIIPRAFLSYEKRIDINGQ